MKNTVDLPVSNESRRSLVEPMEIWGSIKRWFVPYVLIALAAISFLPRLIPNAPSASDSYLFGYNNRVGIILLFVLVAAGVIWTRGFALRKSTTSENRRVPRSMLIGALGLVAIGCGVMYLFAGRYSGFGESYYLIDRIWLLDMGRVPYRDFEFVYGPAQLYGPLFLHKVLHLAIAPAYYLFWAMSYLFGAYFLFKCVDEVEFPAATKPTIFALLFAAGLFGIIRMGTNYTFLRYVLPIYLVIKLNSRFREMRSAGILRDVLLCTASCGILLLLSPETAVAYALASLCICVFCRIEDARKRSITAGVLVIAYAAIFGIAFKMRVLDAMLADGGGAINFPILPSPTILVYFAALFICVCYLYRRMLDRMMEDGTLGLVFFSIPMAAAALGRCDPSHVFWNGLAAFLAGLLFLTAHKRAWLAYVAAFILFVFLAPNLSELYLFVPQLRSARFFNKHPEERPSQQKIEDFLASWPAGYVAPFGFRPDGFGTYHSPRIEFGSYEDLIDVSMPRSVEEKVREMRENPDRALILPYHADEYCRTNERAERHFLETLLLFPYIGRFEHPDFARQPICNYMVGHYRMLVEPTAATYWYGAWAPKNRR
jgi:hypothetical protein